MLKVDGATESGPKAGKKRQTYFNTSLQSVHDPDLCFHKYRIVTSLEGYSSQCQWKEEASRVQSETQ